MDEILNLSVSEMAGMSFDCSCGRKHSVDIRKIVIDNGVIDEVINVAADFKQGKVFLAADNNTYRVCGEKVEKLLADNGFNLKTYVFNMPHQLVPDEKALGRLLIEIDAGTSLIVAVGAGVINDLARYLSYKLNIPYIIIGTAPSMDGYASVVSPLMVDGFKVTYEAVYPYAIIGDIEILKDAPMEMLHAGFGDVLGKLTALTDWDLSRKLNGEHYCETCVKLVKNALQKCIDNVDGIVRRDNDAIKYLMEALVLSGVAIGLFGNSRPASGAEHLLAHFWEIDAIAKSKEHPLHGNSVGVGTAVVSSIYKLMEGKLPVGVKTPEPEMVRDFLKKAGACDNPADLGIDRELFKKSIIHAMEIRPRFTIFRLAAQMGLLEEYADILTGRFYK